MKGSVLKKFLCTCLVTAAAFAATTISASACTTIYVGGDLVEEGTPFVARTEDYGSDYNKLWFISESGKWKQGDHYVGCPEYGPFEWDFTHDSYRFTYFTNDIYYDGICPECGEKADHYSLHRVRHERKGRVRLRDRDSLRQRKGDGSRPVPRRRMGGSEQERAHRH